MAVGSENSFEEESKSMQSFKISPGFTLSIPRRRLPEAMSEAIFHAHLK
jgi:hypothetical protein